MSAQHLFLSMKVIKYLTVVDSGVGYDGAEFSSVCCKYSQFLKKFSIQYDKGVYN